MESAAVRLSDVRERIARACKVAGRTVDEVTLVAVSKTHDAESILPLLEAGLAGIPIFCSDIPPFHETGGDAALYFDPDAAPDAVAKRIADALDADPRTALRRNVRLNYTWEAIYERVIEPMLRG